MNHLFRKKKNNWDLILMMMKIIVILTIKNKFKIKEEVSFNFKNKKKRVVIVDLTKNLILANLRNRQKKPLINSMILNLLRILETLQILIKIAVRIKIKIRAVLEILAIFLNLTNNHSNKILQIVNKLLVINPDHNWNSKEAY